MRITNGAPALLTTIGLALAAPGVATTLVDPAGDFLPTYTGPQTGDLDILRGSAIRSATGVALRVRANGMVGASPGAIYVWGIDRGAGTPRLTFGDPSIGAGLLFDSVYVMFPSGLGRIVTFPVAGPPTITNLPGTVSVSGDWIEGFAPLDLLPSRGADFADYRYSLWVRNRANPAVDGTNVELADFLPEGSTFAAAVPEPASWALMIAGFGTIGAALRVSRGGVGRGARWPRKGMPA
jgi:hypothetical protein